MKTPGCAAVRYAYDSEGRLSFSQDGNLAASGRCSFILYDSFGRQAVTGTCSDIPRLWLSDMSDSTPPVTTALTGNIGEGFLGTGYSISCSTGEDVSISNATMLTASYYDKRLWNLLPAAMSILSTLTSGKPPAEELQVDSPRDRVRCTYRHISLRILLS